MSSGFSIGSAEDHISLLALWHELTAAHHERLLDGDDPGLQDQAREELWHALHTSPFIQPGQLPPFNEAEAVLAAETTSLLELDEAAGNWLAACRKAVARGADPATDADAAEHLRKIGEQGSCRARYLR